MKRQITSLKKCINKALDKINDEIQIRTGKITFRDIIYYCCYMNGNNDSYTSANIHLVDKNIIDASNNALNKRRIAIDFKYFKQLNDLILDHIYKKSKGRRIAVDGTYISLPVDLHNEGYTLSITGNYINALISTLHDVDKEIPINYNLCKHLNERRGLLEQLNYLNKDDILIMDRNYFSADLLRRLTEAGIKTVFRMSMVSNCVKQFAKSNKSDIITTIKCKHGSKIKFRLIKYYVGRELYVIGTTIFDEEWSYFRDLYWKRWKIEIHFRHSKYNLSLKQLSSQTSNTVKTGYI
jgi:hypothetical protein